MLHFHLPLKTSHLCQEQHSYHHQHIFEMSFGLDDEYYNLKVLRKLIIASNLK